MSAIAFDDDLVRRLPLPLAHLYRRAHNAKSPQERHHAAYYLWEAALKLLGSSAIVEYAEVQDNDEELAGRLKNLARPSLGHWWEFVRRLVPVLAGRGDPGFTAARDLVLGQSRDDLPYSAGLDGVLMEALEGKGGARATVRLSELFDRLVRYRNREFGHGATGQKPAAFYDRVGTSLLAGIAELLGRLDVLAGRRLIHVGDVRRQVSGRWLVERYELRGETPRRLESLDLSDGESAGRLLPECLYLETILPISRSPVLSSTIEAVERKSEVEKGRVGVAPLLPLLIFDADSGEVLFLNARRGKQRIEYLSYSSGRTEERDDLATAQRDLLARILHMPVNEPSLADWAARSQAEEPASGGHEPPEEAALRRLGEFELLSELGRGGMGVVYRAWQPSLGRQVAVKSLFRTGDPKAEARFAREIRALGHVEHPHLIKIFTSGSDGEQWFYAMELVEGATLAAVCDRLQDGGTHPATVDFLAWQNAVSTVCAEARKTEKSLSRESKVRSHVSGDRVQEAAREGQPTVHSPVLPFSLSPLSPRPSKSYVNQVVELTKQVAEAAHALHERGILHRDIKPGNVMVTTEGTQVVLMDLGLAQIADEVEGRLTKTRQFVGTLRYASPEQVLAVGGLDRRSDVYSLGATLWELLTLRPMFDADDHTPTPELMRRIQVEEPTGPRKYHPGLSRDLEAIVLKCLEKDAARRYPSALELVRDLERYQAKQPVRARPVGRAQRGWRWCRRNPALASMFGVLTLVVFGSLVGLTALYLNAEQQREVAEHREAGALAVTKFYEEHVLAAARPKGWEGGAGNAVTLKAALDQAVPRIDDAFAGQPELEAAVRNTLGMTYYYLGQYEAANLQLEKAYATRTQQLGPDHLDTLTSLHNLAMQRWRQGKIKEAETMCREAVEKRQRVLGSSHQDTLWSRLWLGLVLLYDNRLDEAEAVLRQAIETCVQKLGPDHRYTLHGQHDLAIVMRRLGKLEEALELDQQALAGRRRSLGPEHPDTLRSMDNLGYSLELIGNLAEAEPLYLQVLRGRRRVLGPEHIETLWSEYTVGDLLRQQGQYSEAAKHLDRGLEIGRRVLGPEHPESLIFEYYLAWLLKDQGKLADAEKLSRHTLDARRRVLGPKHPFTLASQSNLADVLGEQGKAGEADKLFREVVALRRNSLPPDHLALAITLGDFGRQLTRNGRPADAEPLLRECLAIREKKLPVGHWQILDVRSMLGDCLARQKKFANAEPLLVGGCEGLTKLKGTPVRNVSQAFDRIIEFYQDWGKSAEAEAWRKKRPSSSNH